MKSDKEKEEEEKPFITKYKPYYLKDFNMNKHMLGALQTLLEMDDLNLFCVTTKGR
jgi:hypothetical protein